MGGCRAGWESWWAYLCLGLIVRGWYGRLLREGGPTGVHHVLNYLLVPLWAPLPPPPPIQDADPLPTPPLLCLRMLTTDPDKRVTFEQLVNHPWVRGASRWEGLGASLYTTVRCEPSSGAVYADDGVLADLAEADYPPSLVLYNLLNNEVSLDTSYYFLFSSVIIRGLLSGGEAAWANSRSNTEQLRLCSVLSTHWSATPGSLLTPPLLPLPPPPCSVITSPPATTSRWRPRRRYYAAPAAALPPPRPRPLPHPLSLAPCWYILLPTPVLSRCPQGPSAPPCIATAPPRTAAAPLHTTTALRVLSGS